MTAETGVALRRCLLRALATKRYVPPRVLKAQHRDFSAHFPRYCALVDECRLYESTKGRRLRLIASGSRVNETINVRAPQRFDAFAAKRFVNVHARHVYELYSGWKSMRPNDPVVTTSDNYAMKWAYKEPMTEDSWYDKTTFCSL